MINSRRKEVLNFVFELKVSQWENIGSNTSKQAIVTLINLILIDFYRFKKKLNLLACLGHPGNTKKSIFGVQIVILLKRMFGE